MYQGMWIGATAVLLAASLWRPIYPTEQFLQHLPTVIGLLALAVASRKGLFSTSAVAAICLFLWLHILGARYIYTYVPYDRWSKSVFGTTTREVFGWQRNHYDRFVHLLFGALACVPLRDMARRDGLSSGWAKFTAAAGVMSLSAAYEVFEWLLTLFVPRDQAHRYNGQQGDMWDAQKDMALAMSGVLIFLTLGTITRQRLRRALPLRAAKSAS
jgi:putative membrane protein